MPTVYKRKADRNRRDTRWMIAWNDETGRRRTRKAYTDKVLSERLARRLEDEARARRDGTAHREARKKQRPGRVARGRARFASARARRPRRPHRGRRARDRPRSAA